MPDFTWKIQLSEFYTDQFEQKGAVDKEQAVEQFQLFPWDKEIDDYRRGRDNATSPKVVFSASDGRALSIEAVSIKGYELEYTNTATRKRAATYISNNFEQKNYTVEELIEFFFDGAIERHLKLKDIPPPAADNTSEPAREMPAQGNVTLAAGPLKLINFHTFIRLCMGLTYFLLWRHKENNLPVIGNVFFAFMWLPPLIVHFSYYLKDRGATVLINSQLHQLSYTKGHKTITFGREDIFRCQVTTCSGHRSACKDHSYVWFILHNNTRVVITHSMEDPLKIVELLGCKFEVKDRLVPFLPL